MPGGTRSVKRFTAEERRPAVIEAALRAFARTGYHGTTVADVAAGSGISQAYVFRLFGSKDALFVAALRRCYERVQAAVAAGAEAAPVEQPEVLLEHMGAAYAELIADQAVLMLQVQALAATGEPLVQRAVYECQQRLVEFVLDRSKASPAAVQIFFARGQLCHLVTALRLIGNSERWATTLSNGIRHPHSSEGVP